MDEAQKIVDILKKLGKTVATAESCTGGLIGKLLTDVSGSSAVYPGGVISYSCEIKHRLLGVDRATLDAEGAVCAAVAAQMAEGVRALMGADYGLSTTGIAGPGSDEFDRPVGLVYAAAADGVRTRVFELRLSGDRDSIRRQSARTALCRLMELLV